MAKLNDNTKKIQKKARIQPALRNNTSVTYRNRLNPLKLKYAPYNMRFIKVLRSTNKTIDNQNVIAAGTDFNLSILTTEIAANTNFRNILFLLRANRNKHHKSNQG